MDKNQVSRETRELERESRRQQRQKKWDERARSFWKTFLFTENGKPKSGFLVYTFSLSIVFIALLLIGFNFIVDWLSPLTASWPVTLGNLFASLCVSAAVMLIGAVLHRLLSDKRLMLGTYLWLLLYLVASVITMTLLLRTSCCGSRRSRWAWGWCCSRCSIGGIVLRLRRWRKSLHGKNMSAAAECRGS